MSPVDVSTIHDHFGCDFLNFFIGQTIQKMIDGMTNDIKEVSDIPKCLKSSRWTAAAVN